MALGNKRNILVGAAVVALGPVDVATPAATRALITAGDANGNLTGVLAGWRNVGFTQDGLEIMTDPSYGEVEVDQLLDTPLMFKDGMSMSISTTFAEATLENLLVAWGQTNSTLTSTATTKDFVLNGGELGAAPVERGLIAVGNAPRTGAGVNYGERLYHAFRVLSVESSSINMARATEATIPVTFRAMPNDSGVYGVVRDTNAA